MPLHRQQVLQLVTECGYTLLPLHKGTKRPAVKWGVLRSKAQPLATRLELLRPGFDNDTDWGILNGPASGTYCLDFDSSAAISRNNGILSGQSFTTTPSGGRHYFYPYSTAWGFGLSIQPGLDIPWVTKLYEPPTINPGPSPITVAPGRTSTPVSATKPPARRIPAIDDRALSACEFIRKFRARRCDRSWEGRYPAARAYVSIATLSDTSDTSCGPDYRWQTHIERDPGRPATCAHINRVFGCPAFDTATQCCRKVAGVTSPIGLANYYERQWRETDHANSTST